jgi:ELWxxDGT repeat protein
MLAIANETGTFSLYEINPLHGNSPLTALSDSAKTYYGAGELSGFTEMNGKYYFAAQSTPGDVELWATDGTLQGTTLVKSIYPGHGAALGNLVAVNNHLIFMANDEGLGWNLWSTDGTDTGTTKVYELNATTNTALNWTSVSTIGNKLLFCAQQKLLISDGTVGGTDSLASIAGYAAGFGYCETGGGVYFILPETGGDYEIWRSNGTSAGSQQLIDLHNTPFNITNASELASFNGKIYLIANDSGQTPQLFTCDTTVNGQIHPVTIAAGGNAVPHGLKLYNNALYFIAGDSVSSNVYRIDSTGSAPVALLPNSNFDSLSNLSFANNTVYCMRPGGTQILSIELSGFTSSTLNLQGYYLPRFFNPDDAFLVGIGNQIFFEAYDSATNNQVFMQSDFTPAGTQVLAPPGANTNHPFNCWLIEGIKDVFDLQTWGNSIIMPANFTDAGRELWLFTPASTSAINPIKNENLLSVFPNPAGSELSVGTATCGGCKQQISITNMLGQPVMQQVLNAAITTLNISGLAPGQYVLTLFENGMAAGHRVVVVSK